MKSQWTGTIVCLLLAFMISGCGGGGSSSHPSFTLAWSEYPSWSVFGVADAKGIIDGKKGKLGTVEEKWGVDIVLKQADYDTCLTMYGSGTCDAVCITNMDSLNPALGRKSVGILPTSTSVGADACIVVGIDDVTGLKGVPVRGLEKSVSEYCFVRNLELAGEKEADYEFKNMDPGAAALAMQNNGDVKAIMVWNPFVLQTLRTRTDAKVLFDSTSIPGEIIDMVVMGQDSIDKEGGADFAAAVIDAFYEINRRLADPAEGDDTLVAIGAKFSSLGLEDMKTVVEQTRFYKTPADALALFNGNDRKNTMKTVVDFCVSHDIVEKAPVVGYGSAASASDAQFRIDPTYIESVRAKP